MAKIQETSGRTRRTTRPRCSSSSVPSQHFRFFAAMVVTTSVLLPHGVDAFIGTSRHTGSLSSTNHFVLAKPPISGIVSDSRSASSSSSSSSSSPSALHMVGWEDVVYNAESVASTWASISLDDPSNLVTSLPIMYGAGLLTSFSPCVWGLLPLTMSYISNAAGERADQQTTLPTLAFAAGLAVVFCTLGVTAAQLGGVFGASNNDTHGINVIGIASNTICFLMGLQLLELIKVPLPSLDFARASSINNNYNENSQPILLDGKGQILNDVKNGKASDEQGSLFRTFLLGGSSALVASPCATPVLTSILAFVAKTQNPVLGGALLLGYTLGYSTPLLLLASTGGQVLVDLRKRQSEGGLYATVAPWVTPFTGGILLWYGTNGFLTSVFGDPSIAGLDILF